MKDTAPRAEKLYIRLLALLAICAFVAAGVASIGQLLWRPPFSHTKPDLYGVLSAGFMGFGFVFGSFHTYTQRKSSENPKLGVARHYLFLLFVGIFNLCFAGYFAYTNFKDLGY